MRFMTKPLELHLILEKVAHYAKSNTIRSEILALEPSTDLLFVERQLNEVDQMLSLIERQGILPLMEDYDIHELIQYASLDRAFTLQELLYVRLFLVMEKDMLSYFKETEKNKISLGILLSYFEGIHSHGSLLKYMDSKMDQDGQILDDATPELQHIRRELKKIDKQIQDKLQKLLIDQSNYLNELVIVMRNDRFCIPVKDAYKHKIKGIIHDVSASKQTVYIEPEATRQLTAEKEALKIQEEREIEKIVHLMSEAVHDAKESLKDNLDLFLILDFNQAKARYAKDIRAKKPQINVEGRISLIKAKHPLLDLESAVPIHVELNDDVRILLITGPNTGGKTVALKTVGLLTLMTQSGLLIPASESSQVALFDQVFADIGDEQSILQSLSTFSSHMTKIIKMIDTIDDHTLVLLDELGSGTDPNEGVSLAMAILNRLTQYNIRMMVTTHYSELKSFAYEKPHMATASVAFDKETLKPLYFLQMGTTGSSHAFLIARRLGLQEDVVLNAEKIYEGRQTDLAKIMEKLNDEMLYIEREKERIAKIYEEVSSEKKSYQQAKEKLLKDQDAIILKTKEREEKKWRELKEEVMMILKELSEKRELSNPEIANLKYQLNQSVKQEGILTFDDEIAVGDDVFITPYQQYGKVKSIKGDDVRVTFGKFDLTFHIADLRKEEPKKSVQKIVRPKKIDTNTEPTRKGKMEVDLRGYRFEEVKEALDQAIDDAMLSGLSTLRIIHGFGSGAVRKAVYDYIKGSPYINSHRYGGEGEGLNGVTIITLK
ncbi:MAG: endonuclease MutS2 [Acholeplasmataceae bacterium]|nr:endonuclease MutS2 [Acholeplasmataceae bacterium]